MRTLMSSEKPYWLEHSIPNPNPCCHSLSTALIQNLSAEAIYAYLTTLCTNTISVQYVVLDQIITPIIVGAGRRMQTSQHPFFCSEHRECDTPFCPFMYEHHILIITVDYLTVSSHHQNANVGCNESTAYFDGLEQFFKDHAPRRRQRRLVLCVCVCVCVYRNHFLQGLLDRPGVC